MLRRHSIYKLAALATLIIWIANVDIAEAGREKDWIVLENCRLVPNKANDGDSFHIRANDTEYAKSSMHFV